MRTYISAAAVSVLLLATPVFAESTDLQAQTQAGAQAASFTTSSITTGPAPLSVSFNINHPADQSHYYQFFMGDQDIAPDKAITQLQDCESVSGCSGVVSHRYETPGTYTAALYKREKSQQGYEIFKSYADSFAHATLVQSQTISVTDPSSPASTVPAQPTLVGGLSTAKYGNAQDQIATLMAQIQQLLTIIAQLKGGAAAPSTGAAAACLDLRGSFGPDDADEGTNGEVSKLQGFLISQGFLASHLPRGYFGPATMRALQQWQKSKGIASSGDPESTGYGFFGPKTRGAMACGNSVSSTASAWHATTPASTNTTPKPTGGCTSYKATNNPNSTDPCTYYIDPQTTSSAAPHIQVKSVVPVPGGHTVNVVFLGVPDGWHLRVIGVSGKANALPVSSITLLPVDGEYTGNAVVNYYQPSGGENSAALFVPSTAPAGSYVVEVSDPSSWATKLRTPAFALPHSSGEANTIENAPITVTAPNGGEQWEEGTLNTITWTPESSTPIPTNMPGDVVAYLETKNPDGSFAVIGRVVEAGKGSIHWDTGTITSLEGGQASAKYATPGTGYYIRVVNNKTGASDRSDAPFTLLKKPVDLKVNGSDGPVTLSKGQKVSISWSAFGMANCSVNGVQASLGDGTAWIEDLTSTGSTSAYYTGNGSSNIVSFGCSTPGTQMYIWDSVEVNPSAR